MGKKLYIGVDLGGTSMRAGVVNVKSGELLALAKRKTRQIGRASCRERV